MIIFNYKTCIQILKAIEKNNLQKKLNKSLA